MSNKHMLTKRYLLVFHFNTEYCHIDFKNVYIKKRIIFRSFKKIT